MIILNTDRQIVHANLAAIDFFKQHSGLPQLGLRPGEALRCARAAAAPGGCGTREFCRNCGAPEAILIGWEGGNRGPGDPHHPGLGGRLGAPHRRPKYEP
jgi:hypothetical protein